MNSYIASSQDLPHSPHWKVITHAHLLCRSTWVECSSPSVCLFVRSNDLKVFKLGIWNVLAIAIVT